MAARRRTPSASPAFIEAQADTFEEACAELRAGRKQNHWMWFIFPQLAALARSERARFYGPSGRAEASAYGTHPILGPRLVTAVAVALASGERDPHRLMGTPDDIKLRSCLTLFHRICPGEPIFARGLATFYGGQADGARTRC